MPTIEEMGNPKVVIVGGGFGGLACARALHRKPVDVTLLDTHNFHLFTPLLYQVATALLNPSEIGYPFRTIFRRSPNVRFRQELVTGVDLEHKLVRARNGHGIPYDYLVLATGSTNNYFGNQALAKHTVGMKTIEEALRLRNHVLSCLERASQETDDGERRRWLTFVVVGGGPTGVEYAGALAELLKLVLGRDHPELPPDLGRIILVEGMDRLLGAFDQRLSAYAERTLAKRGIDVRTGVILGHATDQSVHLSNGDVIPTRTIVWSAGVRPNQPPGTEHLHTSRSHRLAVDEHFRLSGYQGAFAIGDVASRSANGGELPMLSPFAMQGGRHVANVILQEVKRGPTADLGKPFRYRDKGTMATIGRNAAVGQIGRFRFTGFIGWVAWLLVHIYYLIGFRNRLVVLAAWGWNYLRKDRPIRLVVQADPDPIADSLLPPSPGEAGDIDQRAESEREAARSSGP